MFDLKFDPQKIGYDLRKMQFDLEAQFPVLRDARVGWENFWKQVIPAEAPPPAEEETTPIRQEATSVDMPYKIKPINELLTAFRISMPKTVVDTKPRNDDVIDVYMDVI